MKSNIGQLMLLVSIFSTGQAIAGSKECSPALELFPAEYASEAEDQVRFLTKSPLSLEVERYELSPKDKLVKIWLKEGGGKELGKLTGKYLEKRLAVVSDGRVLSAPQIKTKIESNEFVVSFDTQGSYDLFVDRLENQNC